MPGLYYRFVTHTYLNMGLKEEGILGKLFTRKLGDSTTKIRSFVKKIKNKKMNRK